MAREVLLMNDIEGLGAEGDVLEVAEGYARNYLLPRGLAAPVTEATRRGLEKRRAQREAQQAEQRQNAEGLGRALNQASVTLTVKAGEEGKLFGSVTSADIRDALAEQGFELDRRQIALDEALRELGVYTVGVRLHPEVEASVKVWVVEE
jgi:large subunit ribosomal protein L9